MEVSTVKSEYIGGDIGRFDKFEWESNNWNLLFR